MDPVHGRFKTPDLHKPIKQLVHLSYFLQVQIFDVNNTFSMKQSSAFVYANVLTEFTGNLPQMNPCKVEVNNFTHYVDVISKRVDAIVSKSQCMSTLYQQ